MSLSEDRLEHAPCGFFSFTDDGAVSFINGTLLDMLGYAREEVVGKHVERLLTIGSRIFYQTHWFPLLRLHGEADEIFLMLRAQSGEDIGTLSNARRREHDGEIRYDCVVMRVRERQKYEDELLRARRAADSANAELEAQKRELEQANRMLEQQALELEFQHQQLQEQAVELEASGEELRILNHRLLERTDEAERLRDLAEEANQAKSTFLAVMSHELRTPLNAISGYVELLDMGIHGPVTDAQRDTLARIARSQRHLLRLINEVLNLARIEAGHIQYDFEDAPLREVVGGVTPMIEPQLQQKGIEFEVDVAPHLVARVDREKCQQILLNLLSNSAKFTPRGGRVTVDAVESKDAPDHLLLRVSDSGIGIPHDKLEAVFQPFVQVDVTRTRTAEGSGLGLAISRDLAWGMDGDLTAESRVGKGSRFTLKVRRGGAESSG